MKATSFPFILIGTNSSNGMPMAMGQFASIESAHEAMREDYTSILMDYEDNTEVAEVSWIDTLNAEIGNRVLDIPLRWSIINLAEVECEE